MLAGMESCHRIDPGSSDQTGPRGRVLIVEDDPEAAEFFKRALTRRGLFQVTHTADPAAALGLAATGHWDLVVTDLNLPGMSGTELLAGLRPIAPRLPVILVTADPLDIRCSPSAAGTAPAADALLTKPVPAETFLATVIALITRDGRTAGTG
jgi:CheY-like chemotaxis protein